MKAYIGLSFSIHTRYLNTFTEMDLRAFGFFWYLCNLCSWETERIAYVQGSRCSQITRKLWQ
jgi:hypothetical protein